MKRRRDWSTPILLTISLHLMAFTLFVNQRMFSMLQEPETSVSVNQIVGINSETPSDNPDTEAEGASAKGSEQPTPAAPPASVQESVNETVKPSVKPLPNRNRRKPKRNSGATTTEAKPDPAKQPALSSRLSEALKNAPSTNTDSSGSPTGVSSHGLRGKGKRHAGLSANGGSRATEDAVHAGLRWLAKVQNDAGYWDSDGFWREYLPGATNAEIVVEGPGGSRFDLGITSLCLMAFTGAGHSDSDGEHRATVARARKWLLDQQRAEDGGFGPSQKSQAARMYGHAMATLAIIDLYLLNSDVRLRMPIKRALAYLLYMQRPGGGWDYTQHTPMSAKPVSEFANRNDLSISGWAIMALAAGREAGFGIPKENLQRLKQFMDDFSMPDGSAKYTDEGMSAGRTTPAMTGVANVCRRLLGEDPNSAMQHAQLRKLQSKLPDWDEMGNMHGMNLYSMYYTSLAFITSKGSLNGSSRWSEFNAHMKRELLARQETSGRRAGSFPPDSFWAKNGGGRLYSTAMCVLMLEVYYRYDPKWLNENAKGLGHLWR